MTNGVSFAHVMLAKTFIRMKDDTIPKVRYITAECIANNQILITLQVDDGAKAWCAAWQTSNFPTITSANYMTHIKAFSSSCKDNKGSQCGNFWIYDSDDMEDDTVAADTVTGQTT